MKIDRKKSIKNKKISSLKIINKFAFRISMGIVIIASMALLQTSSYEYSNIEPSEKVISFNFPKNNEVNLEDLIFINNDYDNNDNNQALINEPLNTNEKMEKGEVNNDAKPEENQEKKQEVNYIVPDLTNDEIEKRGFVSLSFDDGPSKEVTPIILEILKNNNVKATFFVLGCNVKYHHDTILQMYHGGHEIANHGYDHTSFTNLTKEQINNQIEKTNDYIYNITGEKTLLVRPPYGAINKNIASKIDYPIILWSIDPTDWRSITVDTIIDTVIANLTDGSIILLHDIHDRTIEATKLLIPRIIDKGYDIVPISELFKINEIELNPGKIYAKAKK